APFEDAYLPSPLIVATLTTSPRFMRRLNPRKALKRLAAQLGLLDFEIVEEDATLAPGYQMHLPLR
ncbi:hypothetical protein LPJ08_29050, partial [Klebsiella pneumoniae]|nr:hypothetical protein [Klebsiella pneumoniae]